MPVDVAISGLPFVSSLLGNLLQQLSDVGLLFMLDLEESTLNSMKARFLILEACMKAVEEAGGPLSVCGIPAVYNVDVWSETRLCGYAGRDLEVSPYALLSSYLSSWITCRRDRTAFHGHLRRNLLWYYAQRDLDAALNLAFDLFEAGFAPSIDAFGDIVFALLEVYVKGVDVSGLKGTEVQQKMRIVEELDRIRGALDARQPDPARISAAHDALLDLAMDRLSRARASPTWDEWILNQARLWGPVWALTTANGPDIVPHLSPVQRSVLVHLEEVQADLNAFFGTMRQLSQNNFPPEVRILGLPSLGEEYRTRYGTAWLDRLVEDRLVAPDAMVEAIRALHEGDPPSPSEVSPPPGWSPQGLASALFTVFQRDPRFVRSFDFRNEVLLQACHILGWHPGPGPDRPPDELLTQAREMVARLEVGQLLQRANQTDDLDPVRFARLGYPWNADIARRYAELLWGRGQTGAARDEAVRALLLDVGSPENWALLERVCPPAEQPVVAASSAAVRRLVSDAFEKLRGASS